MSQKITHQAVVLSCQNGVAVLLIEQHSACSGCHAHGICSSADKQDKEIEVLYSGNDLRPGMNVTIEGTSRMGMQAVFWAFVFPLILMMLTLFIGISYKSSESFGAISALFVLILYYLILYLLRNKMKRKFLFSIVKPE